MAKTIGSKQVKDFFNNYPKEKPSLHQLFWRRLGLLRDLDKPGTGGHGAKNDRDISLNSQEIRDVIGYIDNFIIIKKNFGEEITEEEYNTIFYKLARYGSDWLEGYDAKDTKGRQKKRKLLEILQKTGVI